MARRGRPPVTIIGLALVLTFLFLGALQGGIAMVADPLQPLGMSTALLERSPIETYFWPGIFLLAISAASLMTVIGLLLPWRWRWAKRIEQMLGYRWPWVAAVATGAILLVFEILELFMVPFHPVMHPLLLIGSAGIVGIAYTPSARRHLEIGHFGR